VSPTVGKNVDIGVRVTFGKQVIIESGVFIGDGVSIGHRVTLKTGTHLCNGVIFDDHCISTGACWLGENVNVRTGAIISKATISEDYVFIGPGVVTNHTKHVVHGRPDILPAQLLTYIGYGSIIGSQASLLAGLNIAPLSIIGGGSVVVKGTNTEGVYVGAPCKRIGELPARYRMELPPDAGQQYLKEDVLRHLKRHIPALTLPGDTT